MRKSLSNLHFKVDWPDLILPNLQKLLFGLYTLLDFAVHSQCTNGLHKNITLCKSAYKVHILPVNAPKSLGNGVFYVQNESNGAGWNKTQWDGPELCIQ